MGLGHLIPGGGLGLKRASSELAYGLGSGGPAVVIDSTLKPASFQGDPKLYLDPDGSELKFINGQPQMDRGLENQVLISLFTDLDWAGNALLDNPIGSRFEAECREPITVSMLNDVRAEGLQALKSDVFGDIEVEVTNPSSRGLDVTAQLKPVGQTALEVRLSTGGENWVAQWLSES